MVDRIREILSVRQLTPTQFADTIGVARPIISHILSGRNKPSLEVVQKIIAAFPDLSLLWLLSGAGAMDAEEPATRIVKTSSGVQQPRSLGTKTPETARPASSSNRKPQEEGTAKTNIRTSETASDRSTPLVALAAAPPKEASSTLPLFSTPTAAPYSSAPDNLAPNDSMHSATKAASIPHENIPNSFSAFAKPTTADNAAATTTSVPSVAQPFAEPGKAIRRIVIFYQDGTFTDYQPESK
ncbi:helix-turn-helix domain-containing protein [uncultured Hymenobacter sp.]|uniref:helix-turn-helix domain-containing protein n=1 Tax=uncultured Hymenobacter sp. TaxID=170016 RepID=UPI0035C9B387